MTLEEYKETYFRRWQKRLNTQCWFIFGATFLLIFLATLLAYFTKQLDSVNFFRHLLFRAIIPSILQIAGMIPITVAIKELKPCRIQENMHRFHTKRVNNLQLQDHKSPFIRQNDENKMISC